MAHQQKKDPFVPVFFLIGAVLLGATVFILVSNLLTTIERNSVKGAEDNSRQVAVANASLKPIGRVTTTADVPKGTVVAPAGGAADGEGVYKTTCFACHGTGVAEAPMITKKEQWAPRVANGLPALMETALNGRGAMPARGGNPALSDAEIKAAIIYMTTEAGFDLGGAEEPAKESVPATPAKANDDVPAEKPTVTAPTKTEAEVSTEKLAPAPPTKTNEAVTTVKPVPTAPANINEKVPAAKPELTAPANINEEVAIEKPALTAPANINEMVMPAQTHAVEKSPIKVEPIAPTKPVPVAEPKKPETPATPDAPVAPATKKATTPKEATAIIEKMPMASSGKTHEIKMLNMGKDGMMVFEPASLIIAVGDTVKFIPTDAGHNAASSFTPEGGTTWKGEINEEISVTIKKEGIYIYSCDPHKTLAMVGVIQAGNATNKEAAMKAAKDISASFAMNKERLTTYVSTLGTSK